MLFFIWGNMVWCLKVEREIFWPTLVSSEFRTKYEIAKFALREDQCVWKLSGQSSEWQSLSGQSSEWHSFSGQSSEWQSLSGQGLEWQSRLAFGYLTPGYKNWSVRFLSTAPDVSFVLTQFWAGSSEGSDNLLQLPTWESCPGFSSAFVPPWYGKHCGNLRSASMNGISHSCFHSPYFSFFFPPFHIKKKKKQR